MAMGNKLIYLLVIITVLQTAQGKNNNLLKKIYKALKMPKDSTYLQDIVDIANNKDSINSIVTDVSNNAAAITSNAAGVSNNAADISSIEEDVAEATKCTSGSSGCCTSANPCSFGKGDCDSSDDSSCSGDLICGTDNCLSDFGFGTSGSDCCIDASMLPPLRHHVSEECTCQTMTISLSGTVLNHQSGRAGDYHESAIVNGHPSWINANFAIWYADGFSDWAVGNIEDRGRDFAGIKADGQGTTCPNSIASTNWDYYNGASWVSFSTSVISVTCSQAGVCPAGYVFLPGDIPGVGQIGSNPSTEATISDCSDRCNSESNCCSFEYSATEKKCNLNRDCLPTENVYKDYSFCSKGTLSKVLNGEVHGANSTMAIRLKSEEIRNED